ncbi:PREDICTED: G patch domain-containing protein 1 [Dinoponera quadriceps]|uniref:G patch domain-containing protein 1 n=1 Tax=Dinoponera quadriceps TaxID=609295 RepID=A0A6P3WYT3_DINQU|nr:PREDICTED: G patch domain-containing protein 1 [Dinoponera quadriceps]
MSDSSDDNYVTFGVALDPLDEENIPRKKPVTVEDQYACDAQGRRRFHGAFTGGFSAGYFNTVGTRDGWRPQQFKSSRSSKAGNITQRPEDFMDEEDTDLFGIAPKGIRATSDYADHGQKGKKRERISQDNSGPIPGTPVLKELLKPVKETVGIVLLKKMGWKPGQGVGSRLTKREKRRMKQRNEKLANREVVTVSNSEDSDDDSVTFAPDDYEPFRCKPKDNYFGIGYSGLDRRKVLSSHINLFETPAFCVQDRNKKLSIHGQAFGVGAFEADDEDIYEREDMSRYDFALGPERKTKTRWSQDDGPSGSQADGFVRAKERLECKKVFKPPELPKDFAPVHAVRMSRFYPPIAANGKRRELNAVERARILQEPDDRSKKPSSVASSIISKTLQQTEEARQTSGSWLDKLKVESFVKGGVIGKDNTGSLKKLEDFASSSTDASDKRKLFLFDPDKQRRFEQYLTFLKSNEPNKLESIQPLSMTDWEREQERTEFEQAAELERSNEFADRKVEPDDDKKQAVKMKMFGKLTRERSEWKPASVVCKRFNIPEPKVGCAQVATKTTKFSVFDSLDWCDSSKFTKATEEVSEAGIPSNVYQPSEVVSEKFKIFEASYEKVFGKGALQSASSTLPVQQDEAADKSFEEKSSEVARSEEKKDLFKAIFLSSSSEDSDSEVEENVVEVVKSILIGKDPKEMNSQRNTSPPRGIFAKLDLDSLVAQPKACAAKTSSDDRQLADCSGATEAAIQLPDMYGPVLPQRLLKQEGGATNEAEDDAMPVFRSVVVSRSTSDDSKKLVGEWVERDKAKKEKKKHRHHRRHRKKSRKEKRSRR